MAKQLLKMQIFFEVFTKKKERGFVRKRGGFSEPTKGLAISSGMSADVGRDYKTCGLA